MTNLLSVPMVRLHLIFAVAFAAIIILLGEVVYTSFSSTFSALTFNLILVMLIFIEVGFNAWRIQVYREKQSNSNSQETVIEPPPLSEDQQQLIDVNQKLREMEQNKGEEIMPEKTKKSETPIPAKLNPELTSTQTEEKWPFPPEETPKETLTQPEKQIVQPDLLTQFLEYTQKNPDKAIAMNDFIALKNEEKRRQEETEHKKAEENLGAINEQNIESVKQAAIKYWVNLLEQGKIKATPTDDTLAKMGIKTWELTDKSVLNSENDGEENDNQSQPRAKKAPLKHMDLRS